VPNDGGALDVVVLLAERNLLPFDITLRAERCRSLLRPLGGFGAKLSKGLLAGNDADSGDADGAGAAANGSKLFMVENRPTIRPPILLKAV